MHNFNVASLDVALNGFVCATKIPLTCESNDDVKIINNRLQIALTGARLSFFMLLQFMCNEIFLFTKK